MNRTKTKRLLCLLLSLAMVFTLTAAPVFAEDTDTSETTETATESTKETNAEGSNENGEETAESNVAAIGDTGYSSLEAAIEAAEESSGSVTIKLTDDVTTSDTIEWSQASPSLTIDLDGYSITKTTDGTSGNVFDVFQGTFTLTGLGTVTNNNDNSAVRIKGSIDSGASDYTVVTVEENVTLAADYPMFVTPNSQHAYGVVVNINGTLNASTCGFYVNGQMQDTDGNVPTVNIGSTAKITSTASGSGDDMAGVYLAGYAKTTVADGAEITGCTGIEIRAGELTVNGGTIMGTGSFTIAKNGNGTTSSGIGIAVVQHTTNLPVSVTVNGGTISGVYAVYEEDIEDDTSTDSISISLTGGEYTGTTASVAVTDSTEVATSITGGTYLVGTSESSTADTSVESYLASTAVIDSATGTVSDGTAVASVTSDETTTQYSDLARAFAAASSGDTVTLLSNVTLSADIRIEDGQTITLDLGDYTLDCGSSYRFRLYHGDLTIKNGTITGSQPLNVYGSYEDASDYSVLTVESTVSLSGVSYGICLFPAYVNNNTTYYGYGAVINMYGSITGSGVGIFVSGNLGNDTDSVSAMISSGNVSKINVYGTIDMTNQGIAMNGYAIVNIYDGASITGSEAVGLKRGVLNVYGGTLTAVGDYVDPVSANYNGVENTGAAISVTSTYNYAGTIELNITGGTITSTNGNALYIGHSGSESSTTTYTTGLSVSVTGGDFSTSASSGDVATVYVAAAVDSDAESYTTSVISGGTYDSDVNEYTTSTYAAVANSDGTYSVVETVEDAVAVVYDANGTYIGSTSSLSYISSLTDDCTVQLIADVSEKTFTLKENNNVTLDLNGYNIICTESSSYPYSAIYVTGGSLTVIDSSVEDGEVGDSVLSTTKGNGVVFVTGGDVTINAGNYISYSSSGQTVQISPDATDSTVTIDNGTFTSVGYGMQVQAGTLNINGGTIASSVTTIDADSYTPSVRGAVLVRASTNDSGTNIIPHLNIYDGCFTSIYNESGMIVYAVDKTTNASTDPVDFTNYISISGGYYDMNNYSVARYLKDGYEVATNSDESTSSTYPYVVRETEVASGSIGYGYATIDTDGTVTATVMGTYTELSGAIYRANKAYNELTSNDNYYAYVKLTAAESAIELSSSVGSSSTYPKLIIDLNGAAINSTATVFQVGAGSELILLDSAGAATVTSNVATAGTLRNAGGKLTVYGGTYINTDTSNSYSPVIYNANVSGGTATTATTTIYGGTFESNGRAIHLNLGTATLNGGTYTAIPLIRQPAR